MKVLLIYPPFSQPIESKKRCLVPLGIAYIAGYLRKHKIDIHLLDCVVEGYNNEIINNGTRTFGLSSKAIKNRIKKIKPDFVGVSCLMSTQEKNAINVCKIAKSVNDKIHTIIGGCHPSVFYNKLIDNEYIDSVVVGEGEKSTYDIIRGFKSGIVISKPIDIDSIPFPARDLLPMEDYFKINMPENIFSPNKRVTQVVTSRGCPFKCTFCATTRFHGKWRGRHWKDVVDEIRYLKTTYNIDEVNFLDENLVVDKKRTISIMNGIKDMNIAWSNPGGIWINGLDYEILNTMKKAGCYQLTFPVESFNKRILKEVINKPLDISKVAPLVDYCHKLKIDVHAFFICGYPEQSLEDMLEDFKMAKRVGFDSASFHIITPLPGSKIYDKYSNQIDLNNINYIHSTIPHPNLSEKQIETLVNEFNINYNKSYKWRHPIKYFKKYVLLPYIKNFDNPLQRV